MLVLVNNRLPRVPFYFTNKCQITDLLWLREKLTVMFLQSYLMQQDNKLN